MSKIYSVRLDGKIYDIKGGDTPPTEADVRGLIGSSSSISQPSRQSDVLDYLAPQALAEMGGRGPAEFGVNGEADLTGGRGKVGNIFLDMARAGAGNREFLRNIGGRENSYMKGYLDPNASQTFQKQNLESANNVMDKLGVNKLSEGPQTFARFLGGLGPSAVGYGADVITDPVKTVTELPGAKSLFDATPQAFKSVASGIKSAPEIVKSGVKNLFNIPKMLTENKLNFLKEVRGAIQSAPTKAREVFGDDLIRLNNEKIMMGKNPSVSVRPMIDSIQGDIASGDLEPIVKEAINRIPTLKKMLSNPDLAENLTLSESQKLLNDVKSQLSLSKLGGAGNRPTDIPLYEDIINHISQAQLDAHPEMAGVKKTFGDIMNNFKLIKTKIKPGNLQKNISTKFGDDEINKAAETLLVNRQDIIKKINNFRRIRKAGKAAIGSLAAEELLIGGIRKKLGG